MSGQHIQVNRAAPPAFNVLEPEGHFIGTEIEDAIFALAKTKANVNILRGNLHDPKTAAIRPLSDIREDIRSSVDGLMLLKAYLTESDIRLFPKLKVVVRMGVSAASLGLAERCI